MLVCGKDVNIRWKQNQLQWMLEIDPGARSSIYCGFLFEIS
jgi:hypothetical protein